MKPIYVEDPRPLLLKVKEKFPWLDVNSNFNVDKLLSFLQDNDRLWNQDCVEAAIEFLKPSLEWDANWRPPQPPPPPPPPPTPEPEKLEPWQLPIPASKQQIARASVRAIKDYLGRLRAVAEQ